MWFTKPLWRIFQISLIAIKVVKTKEHFGALFCWTQKVISVNTIKRIHMTYLKATWRTAQMQIANVHMLTIVNKHINQNCGHVFDSIKSNNLYYPITIAKYAPDVWRKEFNDDTYRIYETILDNNTNTYRDVIWGIVGGRSRVSFAIDNGYDTIDCLVFNNIRDAVNMDDWLRVCDPHHNKSCPPLRHTKGARLDYQSDIDKQSNKVYNRK